MSNYYFIKSKLNGNVIDIQEASKTSGAALDAYPKKATGNDNQLWEFVADPAGSGYYFIKSKLNGNVIDIEGGASNSLNAGVYLDAYPQKTTETYNQLWQFVKDPAGSGYFFIMSQMNGMVVDIHDASTTPGALLEAYPLKVSGTDNQLWQVVDGSFPATVSAAPAPGHGLGSNSNYIMYSDCNPIVGAIVTIEITQDIFCESVGPATQGCTTPPPPYTTGFGFQLNCFSAKNYKCAWQQYVMAFWLNASGGFNVIYGVDNWPVSGKNLINSGFPTLTTLPSAVLPAGYRLFMNFGNQTPTGSSGPTVTSAAWSIRDNHGNLLADTSQVLTSISGADSSDLAPITAYELNLVGPINGETATLSSGAGFIIYGELSPARFSVATLPPGGKTGELACTETTAGTCETANTFYGYLPSNSTGSFTQSFEVSTTKAMIRREGTARPETRLSEADRQRILGFKANS